MLLEQLPELALGAGERKQIVFDADEQVPLIFLRLSDALVEELSDFGLTQFSAVFGELVPVFSGAFEIGFPELSGRSSGRGHDYPNQDDERENVEEVVEHFLAHSARAASF